MSTSYLVSCAVLIVGAILVRALPITPRIAHDDDAWFSDIPLDPRSVALLRQGPYGVVLTVLAELHATGVIDASDPARPRWVAPLRPEQYDDPLCTAVYVAVGWCPDPRLMAVLPSVRRACRPLAPALVGRGLLPGRRRGLLSLALLAEAAFLATALVVEARPGQSTVVSALVVVALALLTAVLSPRRTVAGRRVLRAERNLLEDRLAASQAPTTPLVAAMVAADGRGALELLCGTYVPVGALVEPLARPATATARPGPATHTRTTPTRATPGTRMPAAVRPAPAMSWTAMSGTVPAGATKTPGEKALEMATAA